MNLEEKRTRLKNLLEDNISVGNVGTAIAITGSWGVGKTFFWNSFREQVNFKKKYVYVSLFGLESLSDLKTHIYSNIENNHSALEIPRWIRGLPSILKDTRISQFGVSASAKVFDSLMFNQVKDAIICFDDFERMSNKLDIKDVMGLANQLKLEKNCQVILILDEDKAEDENKKKYAEYKEKLIDETIIINSVEPLIRANAQDMEEPLIELMVKFADELEIHNFRFFQKVIKLYKEFRKQLPEKVAYSTKEIILIRILQGYLITDFGNTLKIDWNDFTTENAYELLDESKDEDLENVTNLTLRKMSKVSYDFISNSDGWFIQFKNWFEQRDQVNKNILYDLINSELISERVNILKEVKRQLWNKFWNNQIKDNFPNELYELSIQFIGLDNIENLDFAYQILGELGAHELASRFKEKVCKWIRQELKYDQLGFINKFASWRRSKNLFYDYIDEYEKLNLYIGLPTLLETVHQYTIERAWDSEHERCLEIASKDDWSKLLFEQIPNDERFSYVNSNQIASKMIKQRMKPELNPRIKQMITEIYEEKGKESEFYRNYMNYLISRLDN